MTDFVLALHSHLPYVLNHGRWPHGSDWLCEAAIDTYVPLLEELTALERDGVRAPITIGLTPVLANQLAHPAFPDELEHLLAERLRACDRAATDFAATGERHLEGLVPFWRERLERLRRTFRDADGNLVGAFRDLQDRGALEVISSAATHGYLPLLARDESVRLQLHVGYSEYGRLFGRTPAGCWLPECAYRPRGPWGPPGSLRPHANRAGTDEHLAAVGFRYFFADSHLAAAGAPLGAYHDVPLGAERFDADRHDPDRPAAAVTGGSPYSAYRVSDPQVSPVRAFIRDPRSSMQVWSRDHGYPGDESYLEFHKIRWPGGLKLWRVTGPRTDLGDKQAYDVATARSRASDHAGHFASLLRSIVAERRGVADVVVAPFDTELFGHWWFEGVAFLGDTYRALRSVPGLRAATASEHLERCPTGPTLRLAEGSWGANGDHSMWLNPETRWTWERLWPLEDRFWRAAPGALAIEAGRVVLAQAARELLLAQSSDWQFIISTGAASDYAEQRFTLHADDTDRLLGALEDGKADRVREAAALAEQIRRRDDVFPDVLTSVRAVLGGSAARRPQ